MAGIQGPEKIKANAAMRPDRSTASQITDEQREKSGANTGCARRNRAIKVDAPLVSRTALDKKVEITLQKVTDRSTKIMIRVGVFGDETLSMSIIDKIKGAL